MADPTPEAMKFANEYAAAFNRPPHRHSRALLLDAFAARRVMEERKRCYLIAAGSAHTADYVIEAIELGDIVP